MAHRSGAFSVGRLSGSTPPVGIGLADLVLLRQFLQPIDPADVHQRLVDGPDASRLPARPAPGPVNQRIMQLRQAGVLADYRAPGLPNSSARPLTLAAAGSEPPVASLERLKLPRNFMLQPVAEGFMVRDTRNSRDFLLDLDAALVLAGFADGNDCEKVAALLPFAIGTGDLTRLAGQFHACSLLIPAPTGQRSPSRQSERVPLHRATGRRWEQVKPDGRIPIYFMPHMENHFPLALGMIFSAVNHWNDGELLQHFHPLPLSYLPPGEFLAGPYRKFGPGVWMFSNYMWSIELNLKVSAQVKQDNPANITLHGGPSTPNYEQACEDFMARHRSVDIAVHGEGELAACEVLAALKQAGGGIGIGDRLSRVAGITFRKPGGTRRDLVRTGSRVRMQNPDLVRSPYRDGIFDSYEGRVEAAIVETNRGCPFKCTFCDWGSATNQKITRFELDRVRDELDWIGRNRIGVVWIADANFGMLKRDLEIARYIVATKRKYGYPRELVVNYTKNANSRLAEIIKELTDGGIISQGIISIQTTDQKTLEIIDRQNIKTEKYDELLEVFADQGLPLSTDLMIGLPGITPDAFDRDLQRYFDADVAVKAYPTQLLPNSPMADPEYMRRYQIRCDDQGYLTSCVSYSEAELEKMKFTYHVFTVADGYGTLRHVLRFLQWEHDVPALQVIHDLIDSYADAPDRYPAIGWVIRFFSLDKCMPGGWKAYFDELAEFVEQRYGVRRDSAFDVVLRVNESAMPDETRSYPCSLTLEHDYLRYFLDRKDGSSRPLGQYEPGTLTFSDPNRMSEVDFEVQQYDTHQFFWELNSPVSRTQSIVENADAFQAVAQAGGQGK